MGTPPAAAVSLARLLCDGHDVAAVYTQPDRPSGRGNRITYSAVKELAIANSLAIFQPTRMRSDEALTEFAAHQADIAVVVAYGRILPPAMLTAFRHGAVNVHFSLLPSYRGAAPVNWAIVNGETVTGVTTMRMDEGLDTGDILLQAEFPIGSDTTAPLLMGSLADLGADLLSDTLARIGTIVPVPQDHTNASLAPIMRREDGIIDWRMQARHIVNRVRGFQPFPTAHTRFRDNRLTIWKASSNSEPHSAVRMPGEIVSLETDSFIVAAGEGTSLRIEELQSEGKRRMTARDFINGMRPRPGESLG